MGAKPRARAASAHMERALLAELVAEGLSIRQIAARTGRSYTSVRYWLRHHEFETRAAAVRRARAEGRLPLRAVRECPTHGPTEHRLDANGTYRCPRCASEAVARRRRDVRQI